jgi:hypothetical protein
MTSFLWARETQQEGELLEAVASFRFVHTLEGQLFLSLVCSRGTAVSRVAADGMRSPLLEAAWLMALACVIEICQVYV